MAHPNERLKTLCETNDGFVIAKKDLEMRGPGDFLGTRQHGDSMIPGMALGADVQLLEETTACLKKLRTAGYEEEWEMVQKSALAQFEKAINEVALN